MRNSYILVALIVLSCISCGPKKVFIEDATNTNESTMTTGTGSSGQLESTDAEVFKDNTGANRSPAKSDITRLSSEDRRSKTGFIHTIVELIELLAIACLFFMKKGPSDEHIEDVVLNSKRLEKKYASSSQQAYDKSITTRLSDLDRQLRGVQESVRVLTDQTDLNCEKIEEFRIRVQELLTDYESKSIASTDGGVIVEGGASQTLGETKKEYVKNFKSGLMNPCSQNEAQFRLFIKDNGVAQFDFCGDFETAKANVDGTFDGICRIEGGLMGASKISTTRMGEAELLANGKWKVTKLAIVKFE